MRGGEADAASGRFGCTSCYGDDPVQAWAYCKRGLITDQDVRDDAHFIVQLRRCAACSQRVVWILTELVDWVGGDDAQYHTVVPLTPDEARKIAEWGEDIDVEFLEGLGETRWYLQADSRTGERATRVGWSTGRIGISQGH